MIQQGRLINVKHGGDEVYIPTHNIIAMGKSKLKAWVIIQGQKIEFDPVHFKEIFDAWSEPAATTGGHDDNAKPATGPFHPGQQAKFTPPEEVNKGASQLE